MPIATKYLTAQQAAARLGVTTETLYAYVSRGLIKSERAPGKTRSRQYLVEDVERLKERQELRSDPQASTRRSLNWGGPLLESAITYIDSGSLYYRGKNVINLAQHWSVEQVAAFLWTGDPEREANLFRQDATDISGKVGKLLKILSKESDQPPIERCQISLPWIGACDPAAYDLRPASAAMTGARILKLLASVISGAQQSHSLDRILQSALAPRRPAARRPIQMALILCADHELNVSAFTARCVASASSTLYDVVAAGFAAMRGRKHGGMTLRVEALFDEAILARSAAATIESRLRRGEPVPGFGHPLYPEGDPRGRLLLSLAYGTSDKGLAELSRELCRAAFEMTGEHPTIDFALVALSRALSLPPRSAITLFALGRTIGWIAHAIEQYESGQLIRPRARYIGPPPEAESDP